MLCSIYTQLSKEDEDKQQKESESIQNPKSLLIHYALEQGWDICHIYCDGDYSGADGDRLDFRWMLEDAWQGKFQVLLCRSQPRFTRDMELVLERLRYYIRAYCNLEELELPPPKGDHREALLLEQRTRNAQLEKRNAVLKDLYFDKVSGILSEGQFLELNEAFLTEKDRNCPYRQSRSSRSCCIFLFLVKACGPVVADSVMVRSKSTSWVWMVQVLFY